MHNEHLQGALLGPFVTAAGARGAVRASLPCPAIPPEQLQLLTSQNTQKHAGLEELSIARSVLGVSPADKVEWASKHKRRAKSWLTRFSRGYAFSGLGADFGFQWSRLVSGSVTTCRLYSGQPKQWVGTRTR